MAPFREEEELLEEDWMEEEEEWEWEEEEEEEEDFEEEF
jgi:hypothetical protein